MRYRYVTLLLLVLLLSGCTSSLLRNSRQEWPEIGNEFTKALRWSGPGMAATFFSDAARPVFLAAYGDDAGLQIINIRHEPLSPPGGVKAQGVLQIEYYRTPSVSVKKASIPLEWSCAEAGSYSPCRWQIDTLMSRLP
jgi:hypothetical protein